MSHIGIATKANEHDIHDVYLDGDGNLAMVKDGQAIGQHARQRTMTFKGEWFLNSNVGVPWLSDIMGKQYDPALAEAIIKSVVRKTDGVTRITSFSIKFDNKKRELIANDISILTIYDDEEVSL